MPQNALKLSRKVDECKPLELGDELACGACGQGLTLVHFRPQLEQLQDTFTS